MTALDLWLPVLLVAAWYWYFLRRDTVLNSGHTPEGYVREPNSPLRGEADDLGTLGQLEYERENAKHSKRELNIAHLAPNKSDSSEQEVSSVKALDPSISNSGSPSQLGRTYLSGNDLVVKRLSAALETSKMMVSSLTQDRARLEIQYKEKSSRLDAALETLKRFEQESINLDVVMAENQCWVKTHEEVREQAAELMSTIEVLEKELEHVRRTSAFKEKEYQDKISVNHHKIMLLEKQTIKDKKEINTHLKRLDDLQDSLHRQQILFKQERATYCEKLRKLKEKQLEATKILESGRKEMVNKLVGPTESNYNDTLDSSVPNLPNLSTDVPEQACEQAL